MRLYIDLAPRVQPPSFPPPFSPHTYTPLVCLPLPILMSEHTHSNLSIELSNAHTDTCFETTVRSVTARNAAVQASKRNHLLCRRRLAGRGRGHKASWVDYCL